VIVTVLEIITGKEILPGTPNDIYEIIDAIRATGSSILDFIPFVGDPDEDFWDVDLQKTWQRFFGDDT
jgi:hypothetical protein